MLLEWLRIYFFPLWRADLFFRIRCRIRRIRVCGSHIRKEKVADSKISGYVWTGPKPTTDMLIFYPAVTWFYRLQMALFAKLLSLNKFLRRLLTIRKKNFGNERVTQIVDKERCITEHFFELYLFHQLCSPKLFLWWDVTTTRNVDWWMPGNGEWEIENLKSKMISVEFLSLIMPNFREFLWKTLNETPRYLVLNLRWNRFQMIRNEWQKSQLMLSVWPQAWKCCSRPQCEGSIFKTSVTVFHKTDRPAG